MILAIGKKWTLTWEFVPQDLWMGVYWTVKTQCVPRHKHLHVYLCVLPIPLHLTVDLIEESSTS